MRIKDLMALTTSLIVSSLPIAYPSMAFTLRPTKPIITTFWSDKPNAKTTHDNPFKLKISGSELTGDSFADVFQELEELLDSHHIDTTFDEPTGTLKLDELLQSEQTLVFANTDTGLNTSSSVKAVKQLEVPEPSSNFSFLILGIFGLSIIFKIQK